MTIFDLQDTVRPLSDTDLEALRKVVEDERKRRGVVREQTDPYQPILYTGTR